MRHRSPLADSLMRFFAFFGIEFFSAGEKESLVDWMMFHKFSSVKRCPIVVDLEITFALLDRCVPSDALHDGFSPVVSEPLPQQHEGRCTEEKPYVWILLVVFAEFRHAGNSGG